MGAKLVEFGGWEMPVQYPDGIMKEHLGCRNSAGFLDVSHMLGVKVTRQGPRRLHGEAVLADIKALPDGMGSPTMITNEDGGVIDDRIITNAGDHLYMVINAGHEDKDLPHMQKYMDEFVAAGGDVSMETLPDNGILALQGKAAAVLQRLVGDDLKQMAFMSAKPLTVAGFDIFVARSGYTGEDGFEIGVPKGSGAKHGVVTIWNKLLEQPEVWPIGLGARDSLRLEAGLCLYGNDLDDTTSPVEGSLLWCIAKRRGEAWAGSSSAPSASSPSSPAGRDRHAQARRLHRQQGRAGALGREGLRHGRRRGGRRHERRDVAVPQEGDRHGVREDGAAEGGDRAAGRGARQDAADHDRQDALRRGELLPRRVKRVT